MPFCYRRALGITAAAVATSTAALAAQAPQAPPAPQVTVGGVVYGQFLYQLKDSLGAGHQNQFSIQRAYVNVIGRFAGGVQTRVTADILPAPSAVSPTQTVVRLKYAFVAWTPTGSALTYNLGLLHDRCKLFTLAGEFASTKDTVPAAANTTGRVISGFGVYHLPKSGVALLARVDVVDPNTSISNDRLTRVIGGISYQVSPNL